MHKTHHAKERMAQRGISLDMVEYVMFNGTPVQDKVIIGKKEAHKMLKSLQEELRLLKKIMDKGGVVVVADGDRIITTYNCESRPH